MNNGKEHTGWRLLHLCEVAEVTMGSSPPGESYNDGGNGVPLINGPVEFSEGDFGLTIRGKSTTQPTRMCRTGDLLLCVRGSTTGRTNIAGFDACIGRGVASIRAKEDQRFLNHFIRTQRKRLFDLGNGSTFPSITQEQLVSVQVPLPPLPEQRRIAAILDKADAIRRKREEGIRLTEELLRSTFLKMFGDPATTDVKPLVELAEVVSGVTKGRKLNGRAITVPYLRVANVQDGFLNLDEIKTIEALPDEVQSLSLKMGDIVMTEGGDHDKLGRGAIWSAPIANCIHQNHVFRVRVDRRSILPTYFAEFLRTPQAKQYFLRCAKKTTNLASINMTQLRGLPVPVPSISTQRHFEDAAKTINQIAATRKRAVANAESLFGSLVQRAFRGEL